MFPSDTLPVRKVKEHYLPGAEEDTGAMRGSLTCLGSGARLDQPEWLLLPTLSLGSSRAASGKCSVEGRKDGAPT